MGSQPTESEIRRALDALHVDVPFYTAEGTKGGGVRFHLYGGRVVEFSETVGSGEATSPSVAMEQIPDDLTQIAGVGKGTSAALKAAGVVNFDQLCVVSDEELLKVVNQSTLSKIRAFLEEEHPQ